MQNVRESLRPLEGRARWAVYGLVVVIVLDVLAIGSDLLEIELLGRVIDGGTVTVAELESNDDRQLLVGVLSFAALVVTVVLFIRWFHAAYSNLRPLGQANLRFKPGWAIGAWFVPILNLWRPKQIADDIWRGSGPEAPVLQKGGWSTVALPSLFAGWWVTWIAASLVSNVAARAWLSTDTAEDLRTAAIFDVGALVLDVVAAGLAIAVVRRLTARQAERVRRLTVAGALPATIPAA